MGSRRASGFTLIEFLVIVAVIGIVASIVIPNFIRSRPKKAEGPTGLKTVQISGDGQDTAARVASPPAVPESPSLTPGSPATPRTAATGLESHFLIDKTGKTTDLQIAITVTDPNLAAKKIVGFEIDLSKAEPPITSAPYSIVTNLNTRGYYKSDWQCDIKPPIVHCHGTEPLEEDRKSVFDLFFTDELEPTDSVRFGNLQTESGESSGFERIGSPGPVVQGGSGLYQSTPLE